MTIFTLHVQVITGLRDIVLPFSACLDWSLSFCLHLYRGHSACKKDNIDLGHLLSSKFKVVRKILDIQSP